MQSELSSKETPDSVKKESKEIEVLLKDFNIPVNSNYYDVGEPVTFRAIENFCLRKNILGLNGHPNLSDFKHLKLKNRMEKMTEIPMEKVAIQILEPKFNVQTKLLTAKIKFLNINPGCEHLESLYNEGKVKLAMRGLMTARNYENGIVDCLLNEIITFDVVEA